MFGAPVKGLEMAGSRWSVYRFHLDSPITFTKSIRATIEHGHANHRSDNFLSVAYWYQTEPHAPFPPCRPLPTGCPGFTPSVGREMRGSEDGNAKNNFGPGMEENLRSKIHAIKPLAIFILVATFMIGANLFAATTTPVHGKVVYNVKDFGATGNKSDNARPGNSKGH